MRVGSLFAGIGIGGVCYNPHMPKGIYPHTHIKPKVYPPRMVATVTRLYFDEGKSQVEVAAELRVTQRVIWRLMKNHDMQTRPRVKRDQRGDKNSSWKGDTAGYQALHVRVSTARGKPTKCERCGSQDIPGVIYEWANLTGNYTDTDDYERMCRLCHRRYDAARREEVARD